MRIDSLYIASFSHSDVSGWTIQLGITRRLSHTYLGQKMKVKQVIPHPNYNLGIAHDNDVALFQVNGYFVSHEPCIWLLINWYQNASDAAYHIIANLSLALTLECWLQLERRVQYHEHLRPVCLPTVATNLTPGTICTVIGWGKKNDTECEYRQPRKRCFTIEFSLRISRSSILSVSPRNCLSWAHTWSKTVIILSLCPRRRVRASRERGQGSHPAPSDLQHMVGA